MGQGSYLLFIPVLFHDLIRVFFRQPPQLLQQSGIMGVNLCGGLGLVVEDLSAGFCYPNIFRGWLIRTGDFKRIHKKHADNNPM